MLEIVLIVIMGLAVGWSIGANDAANSIGTAVGSRAISLRRAIVLISVFGFLGAILQGGHVARTIGKGIVAMDQLDDLARFPVAARCHLALVACLAACVWVVLATYWRMPVSTSHSIVGAVAGAGLALGADVRWSKIGDIVVCWVATPLGSAALGYLFCRLLLRLERLWAGRPSDRVWKALVVASGCYVAFSWGANDVANATGVIAGACVLDANASLALGGLAIVLGIVTWGYRVIETVGSNITTLLPAMAFAAQLASGINVHLYSLLGVPVSTSHSIVGAIFGVGLVRGAKVVNLRIMKEILVCWLATPLVSGSVSYGVMWIMLRTLWGR